MINFNHTVGAAFLIATLAAAPASPVECPRPQLKTSDGAIREMPADILANSQILAKGGSNGFPTVVFQLRQRNPGISDSAILNFLITAYCPVLNRMSGLSERQKLAKLKSFEHRIMASLPF